jgi:hypothetical protein
VIARRYFFLSYPRITPVPAPGGSGSAGSADEWVRAFFTDLSAAVGERATTGAELGPGFLDFDGVDDPAWRTALIDALSTAESFVPLLSPEYIRWSWPRREWASFERRMTESRAPGARRRIVPVLWVPVSAGQRPAAVAQALSLAPPAARQCYAEIGLLAMHRLARHRDGYRRIVEELSRRIVAIADGTTAGFWRAADPGELESPVGPQERSAVFAVAVAGHGCPFGEDQRAPLAEYARLAAERLGYAVATVPLAESAEVFARMPGALLIDSGCLAEGETAAASLAGIVGALPSWALPVVAAGRGAPPWFGGPGAPADRPRTPRTYRPEPVRRALQGVGSLGEFNALMPFIVAHAEREYLRHGPIRRAAPKPGSRPRLTAEGNRDASH